MVDLVKLRKKAKEKKAADVQPAQQPKSSEADSPAPPKRTPAKKTVEASSSPPTAPVSNEKSPVASEKSPVVASEPRKQSAVPPAGEERADSKLERFKKTAGRLAAQQQADAEAFDAAASEIEQIELLTFILAGENYAVPIEKIVEIVTPRPVTKVPNADDWILGIISLRGTIVTILDLRRRLGHPQQLGLELDARIIVVENSGETTGFLVDKVARVVRVDPAILESHPVVATAEQSEYIRGVFQHPQGLAIVLDLEKIIRI